VSHIGEVASFLGSAVEKGQNLPTQHPTCASIYGVAIRVRVKNSENLCTCSLYTFLFSF